MIRKETYTLDEVLSKVPETRPRKVIQEEVFDGDSINMKSDRYQVFLLKGCDCVTCGAKGAFFAKERQEASIGYHFNLYAMKDGKEVLMTKDHIIAKYNGGKNSIKNYQPMCRICNSLKGHK